MDGRTTKALDSETLMRVFGDYGQLFAREGESRREDYVTHRLVKLKDFDVAV